MSNFDLRCYRRLSTIGFTFENFQTIVGNAIQDSKGERETGEAPFVRLAQFCGSTGLQFYAYHTRKLDHFELFSHLSKTL
jgi:hypothetical protein